MVKKIIIICAVIVLLVFFIIYALQTDITITVNNRTNYLITNLGIVYKENDKDNKEFIKWINKFKLKSIIEEIPSDKINYTMKDGFGGLPYIEYKIKYDGKEKNIVDKRIGNKMIEEFKYYLFNE